MKITKDILNLSKLFKNEERRFLLETAVKFSSAYLLATVFVFYTIWIILSVNSIYFETLDFGISPDLRQAFLDSLFQIMTDKIDYLVIFYVVLFFAGFYLGKLLLRPFSLIANYSRDKTEGKNIDFDPDIFSDYKFLTRFSEFFFRYLENCFKNKKLVPNTIPPTFAKVRTPPFERVFFFHFLLLIIILGILSAFFVSFAVTEVRAQLIEHAVNSFSMSKKLSPQFFVNQAYLFDNVIFMSVACIFTSYIGLSFHFYSKVSGGIFAFFATMRAFMKGNYSARVHLVGYAHIRPYGRLFNKYLDMVERECEKTDNNVES